MSSSPSSGGDPELPEDDGRRDPDERGHDATSDSRRDDTPIDGIVLDGLDGRWDDWDDDDWDDEDDDSPISGPVRDPGDRVWRHPSELRPASDHRSRQDHPGTGRPHRDAPSEGVAAAGGNDRPGGDRPGGDRTGGDGPRQPLTGALASGGDGDVTLAFGRTPDDDRHRGDADHQTATAARLGDERGLAGLRRIIGRFDGPTGPLPASGPASAPGSTRRALVTMAAMFAMGALVTATVIGFLGQARPGPTHPDASPTSTTSAARPGAATAADGVRSSLVHLASTASPNTKISGLVYRNTGEIVTSARFVARGGRLTALLPDGNHTTATVVGIDRDSDVAVVRVPSTTLQAARMTASSSLRPGVPTVAVGLDENGRDVTVTSGVVAGLRRTLDLPSGDDLLGLIQVDRPVAPSCTGGALVNADGDVVGLLVAGDDVTPWGYAIPGDAVIQVADQLIEKGRMDWAWLGIDGSTSTNPPGVLIRRIRVANPNKDQQLNLEDVITKVDGMPVTSIEQLNLILRAYRPGNDVDVTVHRKGASAPVDLRLTLLKRES